MKISIEKERLAFSKQAVKDDRPLLWIITISGILLAALCVFKEFDPALPWISAMVGAPWAAHGTMVAFYFKMAQSDHSEGGITYEAAKARNFEEDNV